MHSLFCSVEQGGPSENVWEMLPASLHRRQQQFSGQLLLGHLWNQRNQGAGFALPGYEVFIWRSDAGRNDVRFCGHELQRLNAKNPPNQVGRKDDGRWWNTQMCTNTLMIFVPLLSSKQITTSADAEQGLHSQDGRKCVRQSQHVSTLSHSPTPKHVTIVVRPSPSNPHMQLLPLSVRAASLSFLSVSLSILDFFCAAGYKTAWSSSGRTATHSGLIKTLGSTVF